MTRVLLQSVPIVALHLSMDVFKLAIGWLRTAWMSSNWRMNALGEGWTDEENVVNVGNFFQGLPPDLLLLDTHDPLDDEEADHDHSNDDNQAHVGEILLNEC